MKATPDAPLSGRVRAARERRGMSREALAAQAGVSYGAVAQIETGRRTDIRLTTMAALARVLGVSVDYLVGQPTVVEPTLEHSAFLYASDGDFVEQAVGFLTEARDRDEPVMAVTSPQHLKLLRDAVPAKQREGVEFADATSWYRTPGHALRSYREFAADRLDGGATWVRIIGEFTAGKTKAEIEAWTRYEALINVVSSTIPVTAVCLYDTRVTSRAMLTRVQQTHMPVLGDAAGMPSTAQWADAESILLNEPTGG
jgi:transcriptional regulator with XRE-family HTH domain